MPFGEKDVQFGKDISYFAFDLPWYRFVLGFAFATVVVSLVAAAVTHYLYGGLRLQAFLGERATPAARVHLSVLLGVFVLLKAVAYWLDRYGLAVGEHQINRTDFTGLTYTDVNAVLQGRTILAIISLICAVLFFANIVRRTWILPGIGVGLLLLSALLIGGIYPALVQRFTVAPTQAEKEAKYISRNIAATRDAYGIGKDNVQITKGYAAALTPDTKVLAGDADVLKDVRLLDPLLLSPTYKNLQQIKAYYDFPETLGVDRYTVDGETRDVVMAVREVSLDGLPPAAAELDQRPHAVHARLRLRGRSEQRDQWRAALLHLLRHPSGRRPPHGVPTADLLRPGVADLQHRRRAEGDTRRASSTTPTTPRPPASATRRTTARVASRSGRPGTSCCSR